MPTKREESRDKRPRVHQRAVHWALTRWAQVGLAGILGAGLGVLLKAQLPALIDILEAAPLRTRIALAVSVAIVALLLVVARIRGNRLWRSTQERQRRRTLARLKGAAFSGAEAGGLKGAKEGIQIAKLAEAAVWLTRVSELRPNQLKLGDDDAATFPYVSEPVDKAYQSVCSRLKQADDIQDSEVQANALSEGTRKQGILITGEANAGKTRLAFEALHAALPDWDVLQWSAAFTPDLLATIRDAVIGRRVVIWIEDLQEYAPPEGSAAGDDWRAPATTSRAETLRTLVTMVREVAAQEIELSTCRQEDAQRARQALGWPFEEFEEIRLPTFPPEPDAPVARRIISLFEGKVAQQRRPHGQAQSQALVHSADWDGTMGSLVLGLTRKEQQYISLVKSGDPAATILLAMKLLMLAGTIEYTSRRVQAVCSEVFQVSGLGQDGLVWYRALSTLVDRGFIILDQRTEALGDSTTGTAGETRSLPRDEVAYTIRKDVYFERVVTDYPSASVPAQLQSDLRRLKDCLARHRDAIALYNLGVRHLERLQLPDAISAFEAALKFTPQDFATWHNYGVALYLLKSDEPALSAFEHALTLRPDDTATVIRLGMVADTVAHRFQMHGQAAEAERWRERAQTDYERATVIDPQSAVAWINLALAQERTHDYARARTAFERAIDLEPGNAQWKGWYSSVLLALGSTAEAERVANEARQLRLQESRDSGAT